jgi:GNAT superfamily N-acetyltransferase
MTVRRVSAGEWERLRELRLQALADSPDAFLITLEESLQQTDADWRDWTTRSATSSVSAVFVDDAFAGMAGGFVQESGDVMLFGMWVAPERRGSGLAEELALAVVEWARGVGVPRVTLWVVRSNGRAHRFYERLGFVPSGRNNVVRDELDDELALALEPEPA